MNRVWSKAKWFNSMLFIVVLFTILFCETSNALDFSNPRRWGLNVQYGSTYNSSEDLEFVNVSLISLFNYSDVWRNTAPLALWFGLEATLGATVSPESSGMASAGFFAQYYLDALSGEALHSYIKGGVGLIFTDFQLEGQGLRINFNPQMGIGVDIGPRDKEPVFLELRVHHVSNGEFHQDNRGINSLVLVLGVYL